MSKNLVVDLDHSLIKIDLLQLSSKKALLKNPLLIFLMPYWFFLGKGFLKHQLVKRVDINIEKLPFNQEVIKYIRERKALGDKIILATASHKIYANQVAEYLNFFNEVMASDKYFNLSSHNKAKKLIEKFGDKNFDYIGDHMRDIPVWQHSDLSIIVREFASKKVIKNVKNFKHIFIG